MVILQILPCFYNKANRPAFRTFKLFQQCFFRENRNPAMFALQVYYLAHAMRLICLNVYNLVHSASPSLLLLHRIHIHLMIQLYQLNYTKSIVIINKFMLDKLYKLLYYVDYKKGGMRIARIRVSL